MNILIVVVANLCTLTMWLSDMYSIYVLNDYKNVISISYNNVKPIN